MLTSSLPFPVCAFPAGKFTSRYCWVFATFEKVKHAGLQLMRFDRPKPKCIDLLIQLVRILLRGKGRNVGVDDSSISWVGCATGSFVFRRAE